jgi:hypothetical protein
MSIEKMRLCSKAGCGAQRRVGFPCKDWDCPQSYVIAAEYRALLDELSRLREALEPFARADRAIGDEPGPFRFETGRGHRLVEREHFRAAARVLSEREGQE